MSDLIEAQFPEYLLPIISELQKNYKFVGDINKGKNGKKDKSDTIAKITTKDKKYRILKYLNKFITTSHRIRSCEN